MLTFLVALSLFIKDKGYYEEAERDLDCFSFEHFKINLPSNYPSHKTHMTVGSKNIQQQLTVESQLVVHTCVQSVHI